jgi:hypothetical protein
VEIHRNNASAGVQEWGAPATHYVEGFFFIPEQHAFGGRQK